MVLVRFTQRINLRHNFKNYSYVVVRKGVPAAAGWTSYSVSRCSIAAVGGSVVVVVVVVQEVVVA